MNCASSRLLRVVVVNSVPIMHIAIHQFTDGVKRIREWQDTINPGHLNER